MISGQDRTGNVNPPAGTGKTFLAVAMAVAALKAGQVRKLVLVRPAVEAGERLGFLPRSMEDKGNPYLRPLCDALREFWDFGQLQRYLETDVVEICPLAYMRGRTLNQAFVIMDEGQNATPAQMKMFLTRLGRGSKMVVTGDITQSDLPAGQVSGLAAAFSLFFSVPGIGLVEMSGRDIVRHSLVNAIVEAYEKFAQEARGMA